MSDIHPLFIDRPELDALAFEMMFKLHSHIDPSLRPFNSWSDFSQAQVLRAKDAAAYIFDEAIERARRAADRSNYGDNCEDRGFQDPETGEIPCSMEDRNNFCLCSERHEEASEAAKRVALLAGPKVPKP